MWKRRLKKREKISEADLLLEIGEDNRLRAIGIDPDGDSIDILIALEERVARATAERAAYLEQLAENEAIAEEQKPG